MKSSIRPRWVTLAVLAVLPLAACGGAPRQKSTAEGQVRTVKLAKNFADLAKALNISAPDGYMLQPDQVGDTGPSDVVKASKDDGGADAQEFLTRTGFLRGYQRMWSRSESDDFIIYLYQFATPAGAVEYTNRLAADAMTPESDVTLRQFEVASIGGAVGVNSTAKAIANSSVTFVKGPYSVQVIVNSATPVGLQPLASALAEEQYSRL